MLCYHPDHGHKLGDGRNWFWEGHRKIYGSIKEEWRRQGREAVLTSEDNAEPYIESFDGLLGWRWMYANQVPLFVRVYSGRVQFVGIDFGFESDGAAFTKLGTQLVWGEQRTLEPE